MTTESTLKALDYAIAGLCPCGAEPPSGEAYCGDDCRPAPGTGLPVDAATWPTPEQWAEVGRKLQQANAAFGRAAELWSRQVAAAVQDCARDLAPAAEHLRHVHVQLQQAGLVEQEPPTDVRQRALWLRRNRNTGPQFERRWSVRAQARESRRRS